MSCCKCGRDVSGKPVMRDRDSGLECCESCGTFLGGPSGFIRYVESIRQTKPPRTSVPSSDVSQETVRRETIFPSRCSQCCTAAGTRSWNLASKHDSPVIKAVPVCQKCKALLILSKIVFFVVLFSVLGLGATWWLTRPRTGDKVVPVISLIAAVAGLFVVARFIPTLAGPGEVSPIGTITFRNDEYQVEFLLLNSPATNLPPSATARKRAPDKLAAIRSQIRLLENAYLCSNMGAGPDELKAIEEMLANTLSAGQQGLDFLLERLFTGITFSGNSIALHNWGEDTWNELLKKQMIIKALGRAKAREALPQLERLARACCSHGQWRDCVLGPLTQALASIKE